MHGYNPVGTENPDHEIINAKIYKLMRTLVDEQGLPEVCVFECLNFMTELSKLMIIEDGEYDIATLTKMESNQKKNANLIAYMSMGDKMPLKETVRVMSSGRRK